MDLREVTEFLKDAAWYIIAFLVIVFILTFVISFHPIAGNSMSPTLEEGQVAAVSRFAYAITKVGRNDVIVLTKDKKSYVKRVVGLPGEKVYYLDNILFINDEPYKETFLGEDVKTNNFLFEDVCSKEDCPDGVIPLHYYLVLGDNREQSEDSRNFGLVSDSEIKGKVMIKIWPVGQFGKVN